MPIQDVQYSFNAGEISPLFTGRGDINRYQSALDICENWIILPKGGMQRRYGTEYVATAYDVNNPCRLALFEFSVDQAYVFAIGPTIIQVFLPTLAPLLDGGTPVTIATPYAAGDVFDLQYGQSADVFYITHPNYPQAKISRLTATTFEYAVITYRPPPYFEADTDVSTTLTLSATTGTAITLGLEANGFLDADVNRQLVLGTGRAVITALGGASPSLTATALVLSDFSSVGPHASGTWFLTGSPVAELSVDKAAPVGGVTTLSTSRQDEDAANLIPDGDFAAGQGGWSDFSVNFIIGAGTLTAGGGDTLLVDSLALLQTAGVLPNHIATNTTDGERDTVVNVTAETQMITTSGGANWGTAGETYDVRGTGTTLFTDGVATLNGGAQGTAWIERSVATTEGLVYRVTFDVRNAPLSLQVGSTTQGSELLAEATYPIGNEQTITFIAGASALSYVQFRNNQNQNAVVDNVKITRESIDGFRGTDIGKFIAVRNGIVEITAVDNARSASGIIWAALDEAEGVVGIGAWVLGVNSWSAVNGYPRALSFHAGRLWFCGTTQQPLTCWGSVVGLFEDFSLGALDDDAVDIDVSANQMNTIEWAEPFRDLFIGTRGGIHLLTGGTNPITPNNKAQVQQDTGGSPPVRPVRVGNRLFHLARGRRQLRELTIEADTGLSNITDVTLLADHITESGLTQLAYQAEPSKILWATRTDGQLIGYSFELTEEVGGWHRHTTAGAFESVLVVPVDTSGTDETQQVWCVAVRNGRRYIEVMRPCESTPTVRKAGLTVDSAVRYDGVATSTFTGLGHLEGQTVTLVAREAIEAVVSKGETKTVDRLVNIGTAVVDDGQVTTELLHARVDIGLAFTSTARTLPPERELSSGGLFGRQVRWANVHAKVFETQGLTINGVRVSQREDSDLTDTYIEPRTATLDGESQGWSQDNGLTIVQAEPFPATVLNVGGNLEFEEAD